MEEGKGDSRETGAAPEVMAKPDRSPSPRRALVEALLVLAAFWITAWLPASLLVVGPSMTEPAWHLAMILDRLPKALLLLYLMAVQDGLPAFGGIAKPRRRDAPEALVVAAGAFLAALAPGLLGRLLVPGLENPLLAGLGRPLASPFLVVPAVILSCASIGYAEELFFRFYLPVRLGQAGLPRGWAAATSVLLFASAHGLQGGLGLVVAALLGSWFMLRRLRGSSLHELAWGHGLYNAAVMLLTFYAS